MNSKGEPEESKWTAVCKRARLWEGRPRPGGLKIFFSVGGSDSGRIEYNGSVLRFTGKKKQIEIADIQNISEVRADVKLVHYLLYFVSDVVFWWLLPFQASTMGLILSVILASFGTFISWAYFRYYGGWVWIRYISINSEVKDIGFWPAPEFGGSQKLYRELSGLITPDA